MWVLKIGGSLMGSPDLKHWLEVIVEYGDGKVVIVPGGGLFADSVREAQLISNVSDATAHHLALLAMDQYGLMLAGMNAGLATASSELEIAERGWQHRGIIWLPSKMVLADDKLPKNWQVTSDSISAWLANKLGAEQLILVKSASLIAYQKAPPSKLFDDAMIDSNFISLIAGKNYQVHVLNKADYTLFEHGFHTQKLAEKGLRISGLT